MKTKKLLAMGTVALTLMASTAFAQMNLDSVNIKTHTEAGKVTANDAKVYLSSVDISGGSKINSGSLEVDAFSKAGTITAEEGAEVSLASLLLHDGSEIGSIDGLLKMDVRVGDVTAGKNARVDLGTVHLNNSKINGTLQVTGDGIKVTAGNINVHENGELGVASLLMDNSSAENIEIGSMEAHLGNVTVESDAKAYFSTLKMNNSNVGNVKFSAYSHVGSDLTVPSGATLNVASAVFSEANISGDVTLDLYADVGGIEMSSDSVVMIGGVNFE